MTNPAKLLIKLPSRERPQQLVRTVQRLVELCADPANTRILVSTDTDDSLTASIQDKFTGSPIAVDVVRGPRTTKIGAVNRDLPGAWPWDIVLVASDDMVPVMRGYDDEIRYHMGHFFPQGDGCLWFSDGRQSRLCTYPIMDRSYWLRDGHVYWPGYESYYADDEQTEKAYQRGRMQRSSMVLMRHDHTVFGAAPNDPLYCHNRKAKQRDAARYAARRATAFP